MDKLLHRVEEGHYSSTLKEFCVGLVVSPRYLGQLFRQQVGVTFHRYLRFTGAKTAAELLLDPRLPVKHIAATVGYSDISNFNRDFRRAFGLSPKSFRLAKLRAPRSKAEFEEGTPATHAHESAVLDPDSEAVLLEASRPTLEARSPLDPALPGKGPAARMGGTDRVQAQVESTGKLRVWWVDPPGITVNSAEAGIYWAWDDQYGGLLCSVYRGGWFLSSYLWQTGWTQLGQWNVGSVINCGTVGYTGSTLFANYIFPGCSPLSPAYVIYDPVQAFGEADGTLQGFFYTAAWGGPCFLLLSPRYQLQRLQN